jgi:hypothetical protein
MMSDIGTMQMNVGRNTMNERFIELALDAGLLNYVDHETPRYYFINGNAEQEDVEKFAELIVRECMEKNAHIAMFEDKIAKLEQYRDLVQYIANDYLELSYEKAQQQRDDWRKRCQQLLMEVETY